MAIFIDSRLVLAQEVDLSAVRTSLPNPKLEIVAAQEALLGDASNSCLTVASLYYPPYRRDTNTTDSPAALSALCTTLSQLGVEVIGGDMKAWHPLWATSKTPSSEPQRRGDNVIHLLNTTDWVLATTPIPTFHRILSEGSVHSTPDLLLYRSYLKVNYAVQSPSPQITVTDLLAGSDHFRLWLDVFFDSSYRTNLLAGGHRFNGTRSHGRL